MREPILSGVARRQTIRKEDGTETPKTVFWWIPSFRSTSCRRRGVSLPYRSEVLHSLCCEERSPSPEGGVGGRSVTGSSCDPTQGSLPGSFQKSDEVKGLSLSGSVIGTQ